MKKAQRIKIPAALQNAWAAVRGEAVICAPSSATINNICPISAVIAEKYRLVPGKWIEGHGIFLGEWRPRDENGVPLRKKFNVFAAPEDIKGCESHDRAMTYREAVRTLGHLKDWHGFNGDCFQNDEVFICALKNNAYHGEWVIPPFEVLTGLNLQADIMTFSDNLFAHRYDGDFAGTYYTRDHEINWQTLNNPHYYWSCSEFIENRDFIWVANFARDLHDYSSHESLHYSCRPVRFEEIKKHARKT